MDNGKVIEADAGQNFGTVAANKVAFGAASGDTLTSNTNLRLGIIQMGDWGLITRHQVSGCMWEVLQGLLHCNLIAFQHKY
jgi:hypothetical protein